MLSSKSNITLSLILLFLISYTQFGCAPLPPVEREVVIVKETKVDKSLTPAQLDSISAVRMSFAFERWRNGEWEAAIEHYRVVREHDVNRTRNIYRALSDCFIKTQEIDSAMATYEEGIKYFPDDDYLRSSIAIMHRNAGRLEESISQIKEAIRIKPEDITFQQMLKDLYIRTQNYDGAINTLQRMLEIDPDNKGYAEEMTLMIRTHRNPDEYIAILRESVEATPKDAEKRLQLAIALFDQGKNNEAVVEYSEYTKLKPEDVIGWRGLAKVRDNLGQYAQAIDAYRKVVELDASALDAMVAIGDNFLQLKNWASARSWAQRAILAKSDFGPAWVLMGDIYYRSADAASGESPKYNDKLAFIIALGLYEKAAASTDANARNQGQRGVQILRGGELVPSKDEWFLRKRETRPIGEGYNWINMDWQEVSYIDTYLKKFES